MSMQVTIGATEVRNNFGNLLNRIHQGDEHLVVEKLGIPVAVGIPETYQTPKERPGDGFAFQLGTGSR